MLILFFAYSSLELSMCRQIHGNGVYLGVEKKKGIAT